MNHKVYDHKIDVMVKRDGEEYFTYLYSTKACRTLTEAIEQINVGDCIEIHGRKPFYVQDTDQFTATFDKYYI